MITILDMIDLIEHTKKHEKTLEAFTTYEDEFMKSYGSRVNHHVYKGGLYDHTLLVVLLSYIEVKTAVKELFLLYDSDDIIISAIFHDFRKISREKNGEKRPFLNEIDVINYLDEHNLLNKNTRDGILNSRGWKIYSDEPLGTTGITVHKADVLASHVIKTRDETARMVNELEKYVARSIINETR